ncbi:hypothetical protein HELRODRAFT_182795 [Helobdella robusta]|uniref:Uncharacterized protein n=1 Tax=Helobdella robusta TaxID=6412 RepID=T1FIR3_HELRO|nr:hypothetical protein HELRODRAFT_182795 [Helobdella robusta]ESN90101.1 hypothetical protein HELRODRAFT_182795 [Helobdella robusta]
MSGVLVSASDNIGTPGYRAPSPPPKVGSEHAATQVCLYNLAQHADATVHENIIDNKMRHRSNRLPESSNTICPKLKEYYRPCTRDAVLAHAFKVDEPCVDVVW